MFANTPDLIPRRYQALVRYSLLFVLLLLVAGCASHRQHTLPVAAPGIYPVSIDASKRSDVVIAAMAQLNTQYRYGGNTPDTGFDCSGLVQFVVEQAAQVRLPRSTAQQAQSGRPVGRHQLATGDLVFFNTLNRPSSHVGIYLGNGQFINAPSSGGRVRIDELDNPYFASRFEGGRTLYQY